jgi:transposase
MENQQFISSLRQRSGLVKVFSAKNNGTTLGPPSYSPELVPADFYLFSPLKSALKGRHFCDATGIIQNATEKLKRVLGMFPTLSQWLAEIYICTRRLF